MLPLRTQQQQQDHPPILVQAVGLHLPHSRLSLFRRGTQQMVEEGRGAVTRTACTAPQREAAAGRCGPRSQSYRWSGLGKSGIAHD